MHLPKPISRCLKCNTPKSERGTRSCPSGGDCCWSAATQDFPLRSGATMQIMLPSTLTQAEAADICIQLRDFATYLERATR